MSDDAPDIYTSDDFEPADNDSAFAPPLSATPPDERIDVARDALRHFEALTLAEVLGRLIRQPRSTWRKLHTVLSTPAYRSLPALSGPDTSRLMEPPAPAPSTDEAEGVESVVIADTAAELEDVNHRKEALVMGLRMISILIAWAGNSMVAAAGINGTGARVGQGVVWLGIAVGDGFTHDQHFDRVGR